MIKEVLAGVDYSMWAETALLLFAAIFVAVSIRTLLSDRRQAERHADIALADDIEVRHD